VSLFEKHGQYGPVVLLTGVNALGLLKLCYLISLGTSNVPLATLVAAHLGLPCKVSALMATVQCNLTSVQKVVTMEFSNGETGIYVKHRK
jgi:hypothetical protein